MIIMAPRWNGLLLSLFYSWKSLNVCSNLDWHMDTPWVIEQITISSETPYEEVWLEYN